VSTRLRYILSSSGISLEHGTRVLRAIDLFAERRALGFADALVAVAALEATSREVYRFDRGLDRVEGVRRIEPAASS
jgi:predicted nucleic acid-binding protein